MENELKELLTKLEEIQNNRMQEMEKINEDIKRVDFRKDNSIERFEQGMQTDIAAGLYMNTTEGKLQKMIDEEKNKIIESSEKEKQKLAQELEDAKKQDETKKVDEYNQIRAGISDYHYKMGMEIVNAERELKETQTERDNKIKDIDKIISEKEAQYTHLMMRNRDYMDIETTQAAADIRQLKSEIDDLKSEKDALSSEFDAKIAEKEQYIQQCYAKKDRAAKFIGQIVLSTKSVKEIYQILFEEEIDKTEENDKAEEEKVNDAKSKESNNEDKKADDEKSESNTEKNEATNNEKSESNMGKSEKTSQSKMNTNMSEQDAYNIIKKEAMDKLQSITAMDYKELEEIQKDEEHVKKIIEIYQNKGLFRAEKEAAMIEYYMNIESKLEIEVNSKGININEELAEEAVYVSLHGKDNEEDQKFIDDLISKYIGDDEVECDRNIIIAIAGEHYRENDDGTRELTASAEKKIKAYVEMIKNPSKENKEKCSITYDLRKMSIIRRIFSRNSWSNEAVKNMEDIAYEAKDRYADVKTGPITKAKWAIKDMFKRINTPKLEAKNEEEKQTEDTETLNKEEKSKHKEFTQSLGNDGNFTEKPLSDEEIAKLGEKIERETEESVK